jgi:hypothetical protein
MGHDPKIEVHLYGSLRRLAGCQDPMVDCVVSLDVPSGATIADVLSALKIGPGRTSNIFLNGELSMPSRSVAPGDRLGVFPSDMATLYKWYFGRKQ